MLTLDFVAKRYGKLPSEVMEKGTTFDLYVGDLAVRYQNWLHEKHTDKPGGQTPQQLNHGLSQEQLRSMMTQARSEEWK